MTKNRATVSLCMIAKNEEQNLRRMWPTIEGCFDEIILVDTGSTDNTVAVAKELGMRVEHFEWIHDFAAARNFSLQFATSDYIAWLDLDDALHNKEEFKFWRDNVMATSDFWLAVYHYAQDKDGKNICSFARERCWKRSLGLKFRYFLHEGVSPILPNGQSAITNYVSSWSVVHQRSAEDLKKDKSRNINVFKYHVDRGQKLDARMKYYYGKELFEDKKPLEAFQILMEAVTDPNLEIHDRILGIQYAALACMNLNQNEKAINLAYQGLQLSPHRAEFYTIIGDSYAKMGRLKEAIPSYIAASHCENSEDMGAGRVGALFAQLELYDTYPRNQLARVYHHLGRTADAQRVLAEVALDKRNQEYIELSKAIDEVARLGSHPIAGKQIICEDILISCPPGGLYEFDGKVYQERGVGGSETAAVRMAEELHELTGRTVRVFNQRGAALEHNGVHYQPVQTINEWLHKYEPKVSISWRHNIKATHAKNYVWLHDLFIPGVEHMDRYEKLICLSDFHKNYVKGLFGIPEDKIMVSTNGVDKERFQNLNLSKNPLKIVYVSSPDRGLDRAIKILDEVRKDYPVEFHVFYGTDNMIKMGLAERAQYFNDLMNKRPWIINHGNVKQSELPKHYQDAAVWLYPTNFLETSCISAMEMLMCGVYPVARAYGALTNTLYNAWSNHAADLIERDCETPEEIKVYADTVKRVIQNHDWEKITDSVKAQVPTWRNVAESWIAALKL